MKTVRLWFLAIATLAAALCLDVPVSEAYGDAPWCAVGGDGDGDKWDCQYQTVEECVPHVLAGNRGFCNPNPNWHPPTAVTPKVHRK